MADDDVIALLREIRDNQREGLLAQQRHLALAEQQLKLSQEKIDESMGIQRDAVRRVRAITRVAIPGIVFCIGAILYLVLRYF